MGSRRGGGGVGREEPPRPPRVPGSPRRGSGGPEPARGPSPPFVSLSLRWVAWRPGSVSVHFWGEGLLPARPRGASSRWRRGSAAALPPTEGLAVNPGCSPEALWLNSPAPQWLLQGLGVSEKVLTGGGSADCGSPTCPPAARGALRAPGRSARPRGPLLRS